MEEAVQHTGPGVRAIHLMPPKEMKSLCLQLQNPKNKFPARIINGFFCFSLGSHHMTLLPHSGDSVDKYPEVSVSTWEIGWGGGGPHQDPPLPYSSPS